MQNQGIKTRTLRNSSIELLRFFFMYLIVVCHVYCHGTAFENIVALGKNVETAWQFVLYNLTTIGVTGFILISGLYGIKAKLKTFINLILITGLVAIPLSLLGEIRPSTLLSYTFPFGSWWFIEDYLILYILSPLLNKGIDGLKKKNFGAVILFLMFIVYYCHFVSFKTDRDILLFITIYLIGRYVKMYGLSNKTIKILFPISLCIEVAIPLFLVSVDAPLKFLSLFWSNDNIFVLFISLGLVMYAYNKPIHNSFINSMSGGILFIYLITDYPTIQSKLDPFLYRYMLNGLGLLYIFFLCIACMGGGKVILFVSQYISKHIVRIIQSKKE